MNRTEKIMTLYGCKSQLHAYQFCKSQNVDTAYYWLVGDKLGWRSLDPKKPNLGQSGSQCFIRAWLPFHVQFLPDMLVVVSRRLRMNKYGFMALLAAVAAGVYSFSGNVSANTGIAPWKGSTIWDGFVPKLPTSANLFYENDLKDVEFVNLLAE